MAAGIQALGLPRLYSNLGIYLWGYNISTLEMRDTHVRGRTVTLDRSLHYKYNTARYAFRDDRTKTGTLHGSDNIRIIKTFRLN